MIKIGIGGWTYEPWRGAFYPKGLPHARELSFAARAVTAIEINGTFYGSQKPESFRRWADEVPDDFVFALKGPRYATNRRVLAEAGPSVERFFASGVFELKEKLGPVLWQFPPTKTFDAEDFEAFLALLPRKGGGRALRHAVEVRHESFCAPEFVALARKFHAAIVYADAEKYPSIADVSGGLVYARLQRASENIVTGYSAPQIAKWAKRITAWADGGAPSDLPTVTPLASSKAKEKRDVFAFMINGAKERAPAGAMALLKKLD